MRHLLLTTIAAVLVVGIAFADPIHDVAWKGDLAGVQRELNKGADVNAKDDGLSFPRGPVFFSTTSTTIIASLSSCGSGFA